MTHLAHYSRDQYVLLPDDFDLRDDYATPKTYTALLCTNTGHRLGGSVRVVVDHDATGTGTPGTGNTRVKRAR